MGLGLGLGSSIVGLTGRPLSLMKLQAAAFTGLEGNPEDDAVMSSPPTVATSASATSALSSLYTFVNHPEVFRTSGGIPTARIDGTGVANGLWCFPVTKVGNGTTGSGNLGGTFTGDTEDQVNSWSMAVSTNADVIEFKVTKNTAGRGYRFIVDGQYVSLSPTDVSGLAGSSSYIKLTFASAVTRTITIEGSPSTSTGFARVAVDPNYSVSQPANMNVTALFGGDSFFEGLNNFPSPNVSFSAPDIIGRKLALGRIFNLSIGTTGYVNTGSGNRRKLVDQVTHDWSRFQAYPPDLIVIASGYNDKDGTSSNSTLLNNGKAQALAAWQAIRSMYPNSLVVVCGCFAGKTGPNADVLAFENGIKDQYDAWADAFSMWVPISTDPSPWIYGTGSTASPAGNGNSDTFTGADTLHPSPAGQAEIASRFCDTFRTNLAGFTI